MVLDDRISAEKIMFIYTNKKKHHKSGVYFTSSLAFYTDQDLHFRKNQSTVCTTKAK
jgi:hypothetical protein